MPGSLSIKVGSFHTLSQLVGKLISFGYLKISENENLTSGSFKNYGGTLSIFPVNIAETVTLDFFGNEVESIKLSSRKKTNEIQILANQIILSDRSIIKPGDYVVHEDHGIGLFESLETRIIDNEDVYYLKLSYFNSDKLFLPETQKEKVSRYIGVGRRRPKLNRLGSQVWSKTYKKTYENILLLAKELLEIYAQRELHTKKVWEVDDSWLERVESTFPYNLTPDQRTAFDDVVADLSSQKLMDRLICGDVGLGKTEIAIRTAALAFANGFQVAVLVPTTVLAEQHYANFCQRFSKTPTDIGRISRLVSIEEQTNTLKDLKNGKVDMIIGTHKLLSEKLEYSNLGLLIIDEEQKFGVKQKEALKKYRGDVNVLTLTATPIPRMLFMAISGIKDVSQISSIPVGRKSVITKATKFNKEMIKDAIKKELDRGGQVYYLHNQVRTMIPVVRWLKEEFPDVVIEIAHGQMGEDKLAKTMADFAFGKIKILVCSTIIENGLDLANVNTLIIDEADKFGLAQLHQIRGRIGRSNRQAYAIFTYKNKKITNNADKRLKAIVEYSEIGSGYQISLSDLEIRGGGNILGREQHGNMEAIGLVLYSKLLKLAVEKLKKNPNHGGENRLLLSSRSQLSS